MQQGKPNPKTSTYRMTSQSLDFPKVVLFDWHGTLVDTLDAMYAAMEETLSQLEELDLVRRILPEQQCRTDSDVKLVRYIRIYRSLHPRILAERRVSRTEIFNAVFGDDTDAKRIAHEAYNRCYQQHYGEVKLFQEGIFEYLTALRKLGIRLAVVTNRLRSFLDRELEIVDNGRLMSLFDTTVCADDVAEYKPAPESTLEALKRLSCVPGPDIWYVGDSLTDMRTARSAGITPVFYSGSREIHPNEFPESAPAAIVKSFEGLMDLLTEISPDQRGIIKRTRPRPFPPHLLPKPRVEADWHPAVAKLTPPKVILFDWHATLADTLDAMYHAVDDVLPELEGLKLLDRLVKPELSRSQEDAKLVEHVKSYGALHPKVKADRKISRTDIFEVLFGEDHEAKQMAHKAFTHHYRKYYGQVLPFEPKVRAMLHGLLEIGLIVGVMTNRDREFFEVELATIEEGTWKNLFHASVCGDDTVRRKPHPDPLLKAIEKLHVVSGPEVWYVGDSTTDTIAARRAQITSVFFNGAQWDLPWLRKIFPGDARFPHKPDVVVNDFSEFWALVLATLARR